MAGKCVTPNDLHLTSRDGNNSTSVILSVNEYSLTESHAAKYYKWRGVSHVTVSGPIG